MSATDRSATDLIDAMVAGAVHDVPDGSSWDEVHRWLHGLDPSRNGWLPTAEVSGHLDTLRWVHLTGTERFWGDEPTVLARATTALAGALWQLGLPWGLRASGGPDGIAVRLGAPPAGAAALTRLIGSFLPGSDLEVEPSPATPVRWPGEAEPSRASLWGPPPTRPSDGDESVLGRLARLGDALWSLQALLVPVTADELDERAVALSSLATQIAAAAHHQVVLSDLVTSNVEDPEAIRLLGGVSAERDQVAGAVRTGAWTAVCWIDAPTPQDLGAAVGAATAAADDAHRGHDKASAVGRATGWMPIVGDHSPPMLLSGGHAGELLRPPSDDRLGLPSRRWVPLHRHPEPLPRRGGCVVLGTTEDHADLQLPLEALTSHLLLTGSPGAGKTTFTASLLVQLAHHRVPFTVIEPVKQEYRGLPIDGVVTWRPASPGPGPDWVLNPLEVPPGVSIQTHIERIVALTRSTLALITPLPFLIELGAQRVYEARGWDVTEDRAPASGAGASEWPTISELIDVCIELPAELGYAPEIRANLRAAIMARLGTLTRGPRSRVLDRDGTFPMDELLSSRVVVNLDDFGDDEARSFFMGLLLVRIREAFGASSGGRLVHALVIEEAHRLLAAAPAGASSSPAESGQAAGAHAAGELANLLAEIRATGEAVVVVDQSPSTLVPAVLANTATKVALRADARHDQEVLASAMGLADDDAHVLGGSRRHEALVTWEGMDRPIRAHLQHEQMMTVDQPEAAPRRPARRLAAPDAQVQAAVRTLVRTTGPDALAARNVLERLVSRALGSPDAAILDGAIADLVITEVEALGRTRRWSNETSRSGTAAVLACHDGPNHPIHLLADGRLPLPSCSAACPSGGCLVGEPARTQALQILAEGPATLVRLAADPEERRRRLARRAIAITGTDAPESLRQLAAACVTVQVFDDWADPSTVAGLVAHLRAVEGHQPGRDGHGGR